MVLVMARTSKTVIGGGQGAQTERTMRAAASGAEAVAQAHGQLLEQYREGGRQANQMAGLAGQIVGAGEERKMQREQFEAASKQRGEQFESELGEKRRQFDIESAEQRRRTNLQAATQGFQEAGIEQEPAAGAPQQGAQGGGPDAEARAAAGQQEPTRAQRLEQEMARGASQTSGGIGALPPESQERLQGQGKKPMERDRGQWVETPEAKRRYEKSLEIKQFEADTERMKVLQQKHEQGMRAQRALAAGDMKLYDEESERISKTANDEQERYNRLMDEDAVMNANDKAELKELALGLPMGGPEIIAQIDKGKMTPEIQAMLRAQVSKDTLEAIVQTRGNTKYLVEKIDWTSPQLRQFTETKNALNDWLKFSATLNPGNYAFITSAAQKNSYLNSMAAAFVLMGMNKTASPARGMTPSTAGPQGQTGGNPMPGAQPQPSGDTGGWNPPPYRGPVGGRSKMTGGEIK